MVLCRRAALSVRAFKEIRYWLWRCLVIGISGELAHKVIEILCDADRITVMSTSCPTGASTKSNASAKRG
ncbi:hypothetical protein GCM10007391_19180 [Alteromonas halophila]|uniref:Uncharacterized protein n=1 Tax=Alteromonas halophila TaxID=516698 RepID=A0A918MZM0_9ALTE|nr:hypothetical protein GCM10007391_19180 [Alteromonas halophila]